VYANFNIAEYLPFFLVGTAAIVPSGEPYAVGSNEKAAFSQECRKGNTYEVKKSELSQSYDCTWFGYECGGIFRWQSKTQRFHKLSQLPGQSREIKNCGHHKGEEERRIARWAPSLNCGV